MWARLYILVHVCVCVSACDCVCLFMYVYACRVCAAMWSWRLGYLTVNFEMAGSIESIESIPSTIPLKKILHLHVVPLTPKEEQVNRVCGLAWRGTRPLAVPYSTTVKP